MLVIVPLPFLFVVFVAELIKVALVVAALYLMVGPLESLLFEPFVFVVQLTCVGTLVAVTFGRLLAALRPAKVLVHRMQVFVRFLLLDLLATCAATMVI